MESKLSKSSPEWVRFKRSKGFEHKIVLYNPVNEHKGEEITFEKCFEIIRKMAAAKIYSEQESIIVRFGTISWLTITKQEKL